MAESTGRDPGPIVDVAAAVLLGLATVSGAYAAYQASLWGGNCQTAYTQGTNKLAEANREMLRGVQERAFDTTIWIEAMKAEAALVKEVVAAEEAAEKEGAAAEEEEGDRALEILEAIVLQDDTPLAKKLSKLQTTRRDLSDAMSWADKAYEKRMKDLTKDQLIERVKAILALEDKQQAVVEKQIALIGPLGLDEYADEGEIAEAIASNEAARTQYDALEAEWVKLQKEIDAEFDKLGKPLFFESPEYEKKKDRVFRQLTDDGNKLIAEGQLANQRGDQFTLTTVLFTVTLFFAGLASTLRRNPIKIAFLAMSVAMMVYSLIQMFRTPFA
jgi:hypothetical protein